VDGVSINGLYGLNVINFSTSRDFYIGADVPFVLTAGDKINVPVTLTNNLGKAITVTLSPSMTAESEFITASIEKQEV